MEWKRHRPQVQWYKTPGLFRLHYKRLACARLLLPFLCLKGQPTQKKNRYPTQQSPKRYPISTLAMFKIAVHTSCSHYPSHELRHRQSRLGQRPTPKRTAIYNKAETMRTTMPARARRRLHSVLCSAPSFLRFNPFFFCSFWNRLA